MLVGLRRLLGHPRAVLISRRVIDEGGGCRPPSSGRSDGLGGLAARRRGPGPRPRRRGARRGSGSTPRADRHLLGELDPVVDCGASPGPARCPRGAASTTRRRRRPRRGATRRRRPSSACCRRGLGRARRRRPPGAQREAGGQGGVELARGSAAQTSDECWRAPAVLAHGSDRTGRSEVSMVLAICRPDELRMLLIKFAGADGPGGGPRSGGGRMKRVIGAASPWSLVPSSSPPSGSGFHASATRLPAGTQVAKPRSAPPWSTARASPRAAHLRHLPRLLGDDDRWSAHPPRRQPGWPAYAPTNEFQVPGRSARHRQVEPVRLRRRTQQRLLRLAARHLWAPCIVNGKAVTTSDLATSGTPSRCEPSRESTRASS